MNQDWQLRFSDLQPSLCLSCFNPMNKPLFFAAISIVTMSLFSSCDSHNWDDHPEKGAGSKHLFKAHGDAESNAPEGEEQH